MQPADTVGFFNPSSIVLPMLTVLLKALTRMYNQPVKKLPNGRMVGVLYKNPFDCLWKTLKTEGPFGWYKGVWSPVSLSLIRDYLFSLFEGSTAHFLRIAPHT